MVYIYVNNNYNGQSIEYMEILSLGLRNWEILFKLRQHLKVWIYIGECNDVQAQSKYLVELLTVPRPAAPKMHELMSACN